MQGVKKFTPIHSFMEITECASAKYGSKDAEGGTDAIQEWDKRQNIGERSSRIMVVPGLESN